MDHAREDKSAIGPRALKSKNQRACQNETRDLFKKLMSWREESNQQLYKIINSHSRNIDNGIQDLVEEVGGLKAELSDMREEKTVLLQTVDDLHNEIRQLNVKLQALPEPGHYLNMDIQEEDMSDIKIQQISSGYDDHELNTDYPLNDNDQLIELYNEGVEYDETGPVDEKDINDEGEMLNKDLEEENGVSNIRKMLPLQQSHSKKGSLKRNLNDRPRKHACHVCDYAALHKDNLAYHLITVHKIGEMLKCKQCPHQSASKGNLKTHIERVHIKIRKYACEECEYTAVKNYELKKHIKNMHKF